MIPIKPSARLATTIEVRGLRETITSYDNAAVGQGNVVNEVKFGYNDFGQLTDDYQSRSGAVNVTSTPRIHFKNCVPFVPLFFLCFLEVACTCKRSPRKGDYNDKLSAKGKSTKEDL